MPYFTTQSGANLPTEIQHLIDFQIELLAGVVTPHNTRRHGPMQFPSTKAACMLKSTKAACIYELQTLTENLLHSQKFHSKLEIASSCKDYEIRSEMISCELWRQDITLLILLPLRSYLRSGSSKLLKPYS